MALNDFNKTSLTKKGTDNRFNNQPSVFGEHDDPIGNKQQVVGSW
jgi:hypothetical protein